MKKIEIRVFRLREKNNFSHRGNMERVNSVIEPSDLRNRLAGLKKRLSELREYL